ncbi:unnamed protein product [Brassica rapa subsp. trilocularis]
MLSKMVISQPPRKHITLFTNSITYWRTGKRRFQKTTLSFHNEVLEDMDDLFGILRNPNSSRTCDGRSRVLLEKNG